MAGIGAAAEFEASLGAGLSVLVALTVFCVSAAATREVTAEGSGQREPTTDGCCTSASAGAGWRGSAADASACIAATGASVRIGGSTRDCGDNSA
ncbi:MAG TPA: hypothetical protein VJV58_12760 [Bradyrhizobium sp.]|uniref:hypothetical protein n=1 Tax=Bradyrhizobium sp. TaxID=376 RepID=UPI002B47A7FE|nr:hypothetical protein [Bradyrhizobium sp.]HKO71796.1 hypothetical protein [Bradyrhizobium sp.]